MSRDAFRILPWVAAGIFALVAGVWRPRRIHWTALGSIVLFAALNAAAGIYVLNHFDDPRWSTGAGTQLSIPSLSGTPVVGRFLGPLDSALTGMAGEVNDFMAFKQALPVALDFLTISGWAVLASFPCAVLAVGISYAEIRRRRAAFDEYRTTVDVLKAELEQVKQQISSGDAAGTTLRAGDGGTDESPRGPG